jgi:hypothetical protein
MRKGFRTRLLSPTLTTRSTIVNCVMSVLSDDLRGQDRSGRRLGMWSRDAARRAFLTLG